MATSLRANGWWVGLPEQIYKSIGLPQTVSMPALLACLPEDVRRDVATSKAPLAGSEFNPGPVILIDAPLSSKSPGPCWVTVPIPLEEGPSALLLLSSEQPIHPVRAVETIRQFLSTLTAIIERELYRHTANQARGDLEVLHSLASRMASTLNLQEVLDLALASALELSPADSASLYMHQPDLDGVQPFNNNAVLRRQELTPLFTPPPRPDSLIALLAHRSWPLLVEHLESHPLHASLAGTPWEVESLAGYSLMRGGRLLGVFILAYLSPHTFSPHERHVLALLADQTAIAVDNARIARSLGYRLAEVGVLHRLSHKVTSTLNLEEVLKNIVDESRDLFKASSATIMLLDKNDLLKIAAASGDPPFLLEQAYLEPFEGLEGRVLMSGNPLYIPDLSEDSRNIPAGSGARSLLAVPLVVQGRITGTLTVASQKSNAFEVDAEDLLSIAAAQASIAIENANLYAKLEQQVHSLQDSERQRLEFIQNVTHELYTPLTYVRGYVELFLDGELGELNDQQRKSLKVIQDKTENLVRLVNDIATLEASGSSWLVFKEVDLARLAQNAIYLAKKSATSKGISIELSAPEAIPSLQADPDRIAQVLDNLLGNAIKFGNPDSKIIVTLHANPGRALVSIFNQGEAIPKEYKERLFNRFYRLDRRQKGLGLGLAIAKHIVEAHGGQVWLDSEEGVGNTFYFTIPYQPISTSLPMP